MKRLKMITFVVIVLSVFLTMTGFSPTVTNSSSVDASTNVEKLDRDIMKHNAKAFRELFGMNTSDEYIEVIISKGYLEDEFEKTFGTPVTPEERKVYEQRMQIEQEGPIIAEVIRNTHKDQFGGYYLDSTVGTISIILKPENSKTIQSEILRQTKFSENIRFVEGKYTEIELKKVQEIIEEKALLNNLATGVEIDVYNNKLRVQLTNLSEESKGMILNLVQDPNMIEFSESLNISVLEDSTNYSSPWPSGARISNGSSSGATFRCTSGFFGTNQSNESLVITAGHCNTVGATDAWYQPYSSLFVGKIGNWNTRTYNTSSSSPAIEADAGVIKLTSGSGGAKVPYSNGNGSSFTPFNGIYVSDAVGKTIYYRGATTGSLVSGKISAAGATRNYNNCGTQNCNIYNIKNLVVTNIDASGGDSGGPVVTDYTWINQKNGYTFKLAGIISASAYGTGGQFVEGYYSPIWAVNSALNLKTIDAGCPCY